MEELWGLGPGVGDRNFGRLNVSATLSVALSFACSASSIWKWGLHACSVCANIRAPASTHTEPPSPGQGCFALWASSGCVLKFDVNV
eukprot:10427223-Alexandrium_andersonii.AAC.1